MKLEVVNERAVFQLLFFGFQWMMRLLSTAPCRRRFNSYWFILRSCCSLCNFRMSAFITRKSDVYWLCYGFFFPVIRLLSWALYFFTLGVFWRSMKFRTVTHCVIFAEEWSEGIEAQILTQWHVNLHQQAHQWKCGQKMKFTGGTEQISFCPVHANPGQMKQRLQWQQTGFKVIVLEYP